MRGGAAREGVHAERAEPFTPREQPVAQLRTPVEVHPGEKGRHPLVRELTFEHVTDVHAHRPVEPHEVRGEQKTVAEHPRRAAQQMHEVVARRALQRFRPQQSRQT